MKSDQMPLEDRVFDAFLIGFETCNRILDENSEKRFVDKKCIEVVDYVNTLGNIKTVVSVKKRGSRPEILLKELRETVISYARQSVEYHERQEALTTIPSNLRLGAIISGSIGIYLQYTCGSCNYNAEIDIPKAFGGFGLCLISAGLSLTSRFYVQGKIKDNIDRSNHAILAVQQISLQQFGEILVRRHDDLRYNLPNLAQKL